MYFPFQSPAFFRPAESAAQGSAERDYHVPVLLKETTELLAPAEGKVFFDGTLGGGGHAAAILAAGATVWGTDQDPDAIQQCERRFATLGTRFRALRGNFREAASLLAAAGVSQLDGILLDLGVSSHQLDTASRGFSFQRSGPLDMRMNPQTGLTAAELLNTAPATELVRIFRDYGEEPHAGRIARRIVQLRETRPFATTSQLVEVVESVVRRHGGKNPATRVFQALRIAVNDELAALSDALPCLSALLSPGGVMAVISFHSLEDRIVKNFFRQHSAASVDRPEWPAPRPNPDLIFELLTPSPIVASASEQETNPRSRSAKLRAVRKLASLRQ